MQFYEAIDPITGSVLQGQVMMIDDTGVQWDVRLNGGWMYDQYQQWLAAGNVLPASPA